MSDTPELRLIRAANLKSLHLDATGLAAWCTATGRKGGYSYWQGVLSGARPFGEKVARALEESFGKPKYWLDEPHDKRSEPSPLFAELTAHEAAFVTLYRQVGNLGGPEAQRKASIALNEQFMQLSAAATPFEATLPGHYMQPRREVTRS